MGQRALQIIRRAGKLFAGGVHERQRIRHHDTRRAVPAAGTDLRCFGRQPCRAARAELPPPGRDQGDVRHRLERDDADGHTARKQLRRACDEPCVGPQRAGELRARGQFELHGRGHHVAERGRLPHRFGQRERAACAAGEPHGQDVFCAGFYGARRTVLGQRGDGAAYGHHAHNGSRRACKGGA